MVVYLKGHSRRGHDRDRCTEEAIAGTDMWDAEESGKADRGSINH